MWCCLVNWQLVRRPQWQYLFNVEEETSFYSSSSILSVSPFPSKVMGNFSVLVQAVLTTVQILCFSILKASCNSHISLEGNAASSSFPSDFLFGTASSSYQVRTLRVIVIYVLPENTWLLYSLFSPYRQTIIWYTRAVTSHFVLYNFVLIFDFFFVWFPVRGSLSEWW